MISFALHRVQVVLMAILLPIALVYAYLHFDITAIKDIFIPAVPIMEIRDIAFRVEIANSDAERTRGLSGRDSLGSVSGLLFVFPESDYHSIWMKDMRFPIDIVWISEDLKVVSITKDVTPDTFPVTFRPPQPVKYILETNLHFSETYSFRKGDTVKLPAQYLTD